MKEQELLELLPDHFARLKQMKEIAKAQGKQLDGLDVSVDELLDQGFIKTATWGLRYWEERYKLPILSDDSDYDKRRRRILRKKRSNKANLIDIMRAIEPTIELHWGGLILPFTLTSEIDYDFSELIRVLEEEKPAHLSYSFTVKPNGYTVQANRVGRNQTALQLISGTSKAGRWPVIHTRGESLYRVLGIGHSNITGIAKLQRASGLVSGEKDTQTSFGSVQREKITISQQVKTGESKYNPSGPYRTGEIAHKSIGHINKNSINLDSQAFTGTSKVKWSGQINTESVASKKETDAELRSASAEGMSKLRGCGSISSGEEVA